MLYTGFLGWQWRQTRTMGADLSSLRKQLPKAMPWWDAPKLSLEHVLCVTKLIRWLLLTQLMSYDE